MSKFKEYYKDPDFKKKHLEYMKTKIECKCGCLVSRCNKTNHLKSIKHMKWIKKHDLSEKIIKILTYDQLLMIKNILKNLK